MTSAPVTTKFCDTPCPDEPDVTCALTGGNPGRHLHVGHREGGEPLGQRTITWRDVTPCPEWCSESACKGEHNSDILGGYTPATGGLPDETPGGWFAFPGVGVALAWDTLDHLPASVVLHIHGEKVDAQADLQPHEVRQVIEYLTDALAVLEASS